MKKHLVKILLLIVILYIALMTIMANAQTSNQSSTNGVTTYVNPIQPGEHPDQTLLRVGSDFYSTGSSFHFTPYVPILHSTDLVRWEVIARVVPPNWSALNSDAPAAGIWEGALAYFNNKYWVYFSNSNCCGQYFCTATNPEGPWSTPTKVTGSTVTGYDNSIFVDDNGTPYMLMKNGQSINLIQQIDPTTGQLTGTLLNLDWVNSGLRYSWAEGPVMCKRNGIYYYFVAGNVTGGQYVLSSPTLTADSTKWTRLGNFFSSASSPGGFTGPNHISQPIQLDDGTWWCLSHCYDNSGWYAQGRLGLLHQVIWNSNGVPQGVPPNTNPVAAPNLPNTPNYLLNLPKTDLFNSNTLSLDWHFFNKTMATNYSLTTSPGSLTLNPGSGTTHILQKEGGHYYSMVTKVNINATATGEQAGLRITNGADNLFATLYAGNNGGQKIGFAFNGSTTEVNNTIGNTVWLKIQRVLHSITGYYSADGKTWTQIGGAINVSTLDSYSTNYNEWVGTSIGLYATGVTANFDLFVYNDGFSLNPLAGYNNYYGVKTSTQTPGTVVTNSTSGDWLMIGGVTMDFNGTPSSSILVNAASAAGTGTLQVWIDNIGGNGTQIAAIPITSSGGSNTWQNYSANINVTGQHDLYFKFIGGAGIFSLNTFTLQQNTCTTTAPSVISPVTYYQNAKASALTATAGTGGTLNWYTTATGGTASTTAPIPSTATIGSTTYYVSQTIGCESPRASIVVSVSPPVYSTTTEPVIDGVADALWSNYPASTISNVVQGTVSSSTYLSANWKATWDANNLYILVAVQDDVLVNTNQPVTTIYNDDGIEIYLDLGNTKTTTYGNNQFKYTFRWNDTTIYELEHTATAGVKLGQTSQGITQGCTNNCSAQGYTMEVSIPWSTLGTTAPASGNLEGLDIGVNDDDTGTRNAKIAWNMTTDNDWQDPADFGTVIMENSPCTPPTATVTPSGTASFCIGGSTVLNANTGSGLSYQWYKGATAIAGATSVSYTATTAGTYSVVVKSSANNCVATSVGTTVTINPLPVITPYVQLNGNWLQQNTAQICAGATIALGPQPTAANGWTWTGPSNYTSTIRQISLTNLTTSQGGTYTANYTDANGCKASANFTVTVNAIPSAPTVNSPVTYCQNTTANALTATGTSLNWYTSATGGTASPTAPTPSTSTAGTIYYYVSQTANTCESPRSTIAVTVDAPPAASNAGTAQYITTTTTSLSANTPANGTGLWTIVSGTGTFTNPASSNTSVSGLSMGVNILEWTISNSVCPSSSSTVTINVGNSPAQQTLTGSVNVAINTSSTYSIITPSGVANHWSIPSGATITSSNADSSQVTISLGTTGGTIKVTQTNSFGSTVDSETINVGSSPVTQTISGPAYIATGSNGVIYSIPDNSGSTYHWTLPSGSMVTSANADSSQITVSYGSSVATGTISVTETSPYGNATSSLPVSIGNAPTTQVISGSDSVIANETDVAYSVPDNNGSTYHWIIPSGATITSANADSSQITISFGSTGGTVSVTETNPYGKATSSSSVSVSPVTGTIVGTTGNSFEIRPNPFADYTTIILRKAITEPITLTIINVQGVVCHSSSQYYTNQEFTIGSELADGLYFVQLTYGNEIKTIKLVKVR